MTLHPFQELGIAWLLKHPKAILADDMGTGKSCQALMTIERASTWPALIICPASLKLNWRAEISKWLPHRTVAIWDTKARGRADIIVAHYDILVQLLPDLAGFIFKGIIFDEAHMLKHRGSARSKAAMILLRTQASIQLPAPRVMLLTGTPLENRPIELEHPLDLLGKLDPVFGGARAFQYRYCGRRLRQMGRRSWWDCSGSFNLGELHERLAPIMLRRTKAEVLAELPPKSRVDVLLPGDLREYRKAETNLIAWLREHAGTEAARRASRAEQLVRVSELKKLAGVAKRKAVFEWIDSVLDQGEKLVVFAHSRDLQAALRDRYPAAAYLLADQSSLIRQQAVNTFQNNPSVRLLVASLEVGSLGHTLTAASKAAFCDLSWVPGRHLQAEDRIYRIGQEVPVTIYYLLAADTLEDRIIMPMLRRKISVTSEVMDGQASPLLDATVIALAGSGLHP